MIFDFRSLAIPAFQIHVLSSNEPHSSGVEIRGTLISSGRSVLINVIPSSFISRKFHGHRRLLPAHSTQKRSVVLITQQRLTGPESDHFEELPISAGRYFEGVLSVVEEA